MEAALSVLADALPAAAMPANARCGFGVSFVGAKRPSTHSGRNDTLGESVLKDDTCPVLEVLVQAILVTMRAAETEEIGVDFVPEGELPGGVSHQAQFFDTAILQDHASTGAVSGIGFYPRGVRSPRG